MTLFDRLIPVAFLACLALAACGDNQDGYPTDKVVAPVAPMDTITQPDVAPVPPAKVAPVPAAADSIKKSSLIAPKSPKIIWV